MTKRNGFYFINRPSKLHCLGTVSYESVVRTPNIGRYLKNKNHHRMLEIGLNALNER